MVARRSDACRRAPSPSPAAATCNTSNAALTRDHRHGVGVVLTLEHLHEDVWIELRCGAARLFTTSGVRSGDITDTMLLRCRNAMSTVAAATWDHRRTIRSGAARISALDRRDPSRRVSHTRLLGDREQPCCAASSNTTAAGRRRAKSSRWGMVADDSRRRLRRCSWRFDIIKSIVSVMSPERTPEVVNNLAAAATQLDPHVLMQVLQSQDDSNAVPVDRRRQRRGSTM